MDNREAVEKIVERYDRGEIHCDEARRQIAEARKKVSGGVKNEARVIGSIRGCRCGRCLRKKKENERFYSVRAISEDYVGHNDIMNDGEEILALDELCMECFDIVINRWFKDDKAGERERRYIEECEGSVQAKEDTEWSTEKRTMEKRGQKK